MKKLYRFKWSDDEIALIMGVFIAEEAEVRDAIGKRVYIAEDLGKCEPIYGVLLESEIEEVNATQNTVKDLEKTCGRIIIGYNPLDYID